LIAVVCAECGETFEAGEDFAGLSEYCPNCGALNDIPDLEATPEEVAVSEESQAPAETQASQPLAVISPPRPRGIPAGLWWTVLLTGIGLFLIACIFLFSSNWEDRNVQALSDASNLGDLLMSDEDYAGAARQYRFVLDAVDHRSIDSAFILRLVDHARRAEAEANNRLHTPPATMTIAQASSTTQPQSQPQSNFHLALQSFQRDYEAFASFVSAHPVLYQDAKGNWRRRRYIVWDLAYDPPAPSDIPTILLRYDCSSRITEPHADQQEAAHDDNYTHDESPRIVHCQTRLEWLAGRWVILQHDADASSESAASMDVRPSLDDFYPIERRAFHAMQSAP
jgi:predicted  nucleic acid-binding Zn-ribbon protein